MKRNWRRAAGRAAAWALLVVVIGSPALAQERTGTVEGVVRDSDGLALPGATVTLQGPNMMGERMAVTDAEGFFRIVLVPPGEYTMTVALPGFQTAVQEQLPVALGRIAPVEVTLATSDFADVIEVTADQVLIDTTSSSVGANIDTEFVKTLATDRNYQTVMKMLPSVVHSNNPIFKGASGGDNMYLVDGADSTDPATNTWAVSMNFDNFQEIQMIDGGVPAEFGKGTGAVVNLVTKSGSNEYHGLVRYTYADEDMNSELKGDRYFFDEPERYITEQRPSINLGGPILKDKFWFFASYEERDKEKLIVRYLDFEDAQAGIYTPGTTTYSGHYVTGKLTYQVNPSHTLFAQYVDDPITIPYKDAYDGYQNRAPDADRKRVQGGESYIADWTGVLSPNFFMNLQYSGKRKPLNTLAIDREGPIYYSPVNGGIYWGSSYNNYESQRDLDLYKLTGNYFLDTVGGVHELKTGVELAQGKIGYNVDNYASGEYIRLTSSGTPSNRRLYTQRRGDIPTQRDIWSVFLQDKWRVNDRLTLNLGVRAENYTHDNNVGDPVLEWGWGDRIQPRLGFAYEIAGGNLHAAVARYHDTIGYELARDLSIYPPETYDYYTWSSSTQSWRYSRTVAVSAASITMDDLSSPYMDELTVGFEGKLSSSMKWGVDVTARDWKDGVEGDDGRTYGTNLADDGSVHYLNLDTVRKYRGIEFKVTKRLAGDKLQFMASYNYSKTTGYWSNDDEDAGWGDSPFLYYNQWGRTWQDRPHMLKFFGSYYLPLDFVVGTSFVYQSGIPYAHFATVHTTADSIWGSQNFSNYLVEQRGSRRLPDNWLLDLRLEKEFHFGPVTAGLYVDVFNVFDQQEAIDIDAKIGTIELVDNEPGNAYEITDPNGTFGNYTEWQAPRSYFFGVKLEF